MSTVELLEQALALAKRLGYAIRQEWLGGSGGGACEIKGKKLLFLDLAQTPLDHLDQVLEMLQRESEAGSLPLPQPLQDLLKGRRAA
jgi:hypothetical protein